MEKLFLGVYSKEGKTVTHAIVRNSNEVANQHLHEHAKENGLDVQFCMSVTKVGYHNIAVLPKGNIIKSEDIQERLYCALITNPETNESMPMLVVAESPLEMYATLASEAELSSYFSSFHNFDFVDMSETNDFLIVPQRTELHYAG